MNSKRLIVGISGASGAIYGIELLKALREARVETHLIVTKTAQITLAHETGHSLAQTHALADQTYNVNDLSAAIAGGSFRTDGMIIAPCSMRSLAEIAHGASSNLLTRAADVVLKERRRLVLLARETPLHSAHLRNMLAVSDMGGIIAPPVPAFYSKPETIAELVNHTIGRVLDLFAIDHPGLRRWEGVPSGKSQAND